MTKVCEGGCLCGAVRFRFEGDPMMVGDCYCTDCRRASGTSHCTHAVMPESVFSLSGNLSTYAHPADSGNTVTKEFCGTCGSPILSHNSGMPGTVFVRVSALDDPDQVEPMMTVYARSAPKWARINRDKPVFEKMPEGGPQTVLEGS